MSTKVALVTGAGSGIGRAVAIACAKAGMSVVGLGRRREPLDELVKSLGEAIAVESVDVTADQGPREAVEFAMDRFGRIDFLINNAGIGGAKTIRDSGDELIDAFLAVHLRAPIRMARECMRVMQSGSAIVNVASCLGIRARVGAGVYVAVKAGQIGLTRQLAVEEGPRGIRANAVAPGVVETDMLKMRSGDENFRRIMIDTVPNEQRMATPENVADAVIYLCSPAATFINGHVLTIDGGWSETHFQPTPSSSQ